MLFSQRQGIHQLGKTRLFSLGFDLLFTLFSCLISYDLSRLTCDRSTPTTLMKKGITRRSFIKRSSVGAVALANASLFTGLTSAAVSSGRCVASITRTYDA